MNHIETELKFFVADPAALRKKLPGTGAICTGQKVFEHNVRYETPDDRLLKKQCLLRLRKDRNVTLTFKAPPPAADSEFKVYREMEVQVDDFAVMDAILAELGFSARQIYQKWRETWELESAVLCVDTLPFGTFLEIEGTPETILSAMQRLELGWEHRIRANYLGMFEVLRKAEHWPFTDITFDHFAGLTFDFSGYRQQFEAGAEGYK
ncbi:class IV adenylate cyclase [Desulfosarcina sp. OttesenSCG-928-B08]|nr:class IV adenylate cyclase [Desulfosarcina sp. OttesenSCG-928-B08]